MQCRAVGMTAHVFSLFSHRTVPGGTNGSPSIGSLRKPACTTFPRRFVRAGEELGVPYVETVAFVGGHDTFERRRSV